MLNGARLGDLVKVLWHDTQGICLFSKRLERGRFISLMAFVKRLERRGPSARSWRSRETYTVRRSQGAGFVSTVAQALIRGLVTP